MDIADEVKQIEEELVALITKHLQENKLDAAAAQKLSADFLAVLPIQDRKDLLSKLKALGSRYPEAQTLYLQEAEKAYMEDRDKALTTISHLIKQGNIDEAINIAKSIQVN